MVLIMTGNCDGLLMVLMMTGDNDGSAHGVEHERRQ